MASKLRNKTARVSFFSFQDMVTTVTGVLMVVMLMLSMDVTRQAASPGSVATSTLRHEVEQARQKLETNQDSLEQLQAKIAALATRVFVIPERDQSGKQVVLVVLSATNGAMARLGQSDASEFACDQRSTAFEEALDNCDARRDRLVFYVRPSGIDHFELCRNLARRRGFDFAFDAAEENQQYSLMPP